MSMLTDAPRREQEEHDLPPLQKEAFDFSLVKRSALVSSHNKAAFDQQLVSEPTPLLTDCPLCVAVDYS